MIQLTTHPLVQLRSLVGLARVVCSVVNASPKGAVSAEISSAEPSICHYLMVNPCVSRKKRKKHVVYTINTFVKNLMSIDMLEQMCAYCSSFILYFTTKSGMIISRALKDP